jgi:prevent-host-death family protein
MSERVLNVTEAASQFAEIIDRAARLHEVTLIVENGRPIARLVPAEAGRTTDDLLRAWPTLPHLTPEEAADFEADILAARQNLPALVSRWD